MEIAKATVEKILDTLSDDDFFNIIKVSNYTTMYTIYYLMVFGFNSQSIRGLTPINYWKSS